MQKNNSPYDKMLDIGLICKIRIETEAILPTRSYIIATSKDINRILIAIS